MSWALLYSGLNSCWGLTLLMHWNTSPKGDSVMGQHPWGLSLRIWWMDGQQTTLYHLCLQLGGSKTNAWRSEACPVAGHPDWRWWQTSFRSSVFTGSLKGGERPHSMQRERHSCACLWGTFQMWMELSTDFPYDPAIWGVFSCSLDVRCLWERKWISSVPMYMLSVCCAWILKINLSE